MARKTTQSALVLTEDQKSALKDLTGFKIVPPARLSVH